MDQYQGSDGAFVLTVQLGEDGDLVSLAGDFDHFSGVRVTAALYGLLARGRRRIVVDLDSVTFMDAAAIGALISATEQAHRVHGSIHVTAHAACQRLLRLTGEQDRLSFLQSAAEQNRDDGASPRRTAKV